MTEVTPDNAASANPVAWLDLGRLTEKNMVYATGFKVNDAQSPLYSAATVAELRAEVERLSGLLEEGGRRLIDENMRASAAERRVGELEAALRDLIDVADPVALAPREYERIQEQTARGASISIDPFPLLKCRYEDVVDLTDGLKRARATITGADPT